MKSVRRFFIGAGIFLVMSFLTAVACILIPIDRRIEGGLFRPRNTAVFRVNSVTLHDQSITYYGENREILQIDYLGPKRGSNNSYFKSPAEAKDIDTAYYIKSSVFYQTSKTGELLRSERIRYRNDAVGYDRYFYYENGALRHQISLFIEKVDGELLLENEIIWFGWFDQEGNLVKEDDVVLDDSAPETRLLLQKFACTPLPSYHPYPHMKKLRLYNDFLFL